jgi:hypothetical protein
MSEEIPCACKLQRKPVDGSIDMSKAAAMRDVLNKERKPLRRRQVQVAGDHGAAVVAEHWLPRRLGHEHEDVHLQSTPRSHSVVVQLRRRSVPLTVLTEAGSDATGTIMKSVRAE